MDKRNIIKETVKQERTEKKIEKQMNKTTNNFSNMDASMDKEVGNRTFAQEPNIFGLNAGGNFANNASLQEDEDEESSLRNS